jgi:hypothetical protein
VAVLLLVAEAFAGIHPLDLDAHANGEPCKICISVAGFAAATAADLPAILVDAAVSVLVPVPRFAPSSAEPARQSARAPPSAS